MEIYNAKISSKGQITIPKDLRERFHLLENERAILVPTDEGIILKHEVGNMARLRGLLRQEIDLEKAVKFVENLRREWRI